MNATVLLVDDEPHVLDALRAMLRRRFDVLTAESGEQALTILASTAVDVVVSDEQMAPMSGTQFLRQCRERFPDTERIVLTGHASLDTSLSAINDSRVVAFLTKPCAAEDLIAAIDVALAAKAQRDAAGQRADETAVANANLDAALADAEIWYQPIVDRDGVTAAHEALLRPRSPALPTPVAVVEAATALERHADLDRHVRRMVARDMDRGAVSGLVFVNVLPESLAQADGFVTGDPLAHQSHRVVIEITERAHLGSLDDIRPTVDALRNRGYRIAVDDLGAGYAGLTSVALLRPEIVKFDLELIRDIDADDARSHLVGSMAGTCHDLGITVLAEGIETPAELATLRDMGFDLYQGYLLGKPAPLPR